jgi:hypothetical protein
MAAGCLALAGALVPTAAVAVAAAAHPTQSSSSINDTASTRRIQLMAGGLAVLGIGLIGITVWFWRSTRPEPEALAPLEMMGRRRWRQLDTIEQRHRLDDVRAHLNDEAAEAARETVASPSAPAPEPEPEAEAVPISSSPSSSSSSPSPASSLPEVATPATVEAGSAEPDDGAVVPAPPSGSDASGAEVAPAENAVVVEASKVEGPDVDESEAEVSGEHAKVHGDPLVRALEKDAGAS